MNRRFQVTVDVPPVGEGPATSRIREVRPPAEGGTDVERFEAWREGGTDALAQRLCDRYPWIDIWCYHHFNFPNAEELVAALRARGKIVCRVLDMIHVYEGSETLPMGNWNRTRIDVINQYDVGLRAPWGRHLHFSSFGEGIIMKWDDIIGAPAEALRDGGGFFDEPEQFGNLWWIDARYGRLKEWQVLESQETFDAGLWTPGEGEHPLTQAELDGLVDQDAFGANSESWVHSFLERVGGQCFVNGDGIDGLPEKHEAHNKRGLLPDQVADREEQWVNSEGRDVMEIRTPTPNDAPIVSEISKRVVSTWVEEPGAAMIWADNPWYPAHPDYGAGITPLMRTVRDAKALAATG
jgi:hypothetical protein